MESSDKMNRITGESLLQQKQEEFLSLQAQAQSGDVIAQYNVGLCNLYGQSTTVDYKEAYQWFEKAAQQGDKLAGLFLGYFNELGVGHNVNYTQAINYYKTYSPSISEIDKAALWEKVKKIDEKEIEKKLSEIFQKANKIGEKILQIKGFCVYYPKDNSFNFKWTDNTRSEFKQPLEDYNKLVEEFKIYLDAYTSDSDDEKYGYWIYVYEDILNLTYEICNALVGRDTLFRYLEKVGLPAIEKNRSFEFALGRCLIDDNDDTDNDYIISGLLLVAGHDDDSIWQNKVGLWYEFRNENKDLLQAENWYKKAAVLKLSAAQVNIERLKGKKEYKLIADKTEGSSDDRLKIVKSIRGNEELRNKWLLSAATLGNENATEQLTATIDVKEDCIYNKTCSFEPSWKKIEVEQVNCKKKIDAWKQIVDNNRKKYLEEEERRIKKEEEARRKAEEERRRLAELDALSDDEPKSKKWIWILLGLLIVGGFVWYYFSQTIESQPQLPAVNTDQSAVVDTNPVAVVDEPAIVNENEFIKSMYKDFFDPWNSKRAEGAYLSKYFTKEAMRKFYVESDYGEGDFFYCTDFLINGSISGGDSPDYGNKVVYRTIEPEENGWYLVTNIWDVIKDPVIVRLQVKSVNGAFKIVNIEIVDNEVNTAEEESSEYDSSIQMYGFIDEYPITMSLKIDGSVVKGSYYYDKQGPDKVLTLSGVYKDGELDIYESDKDGMQTGHFRGQYSNKVYYGEFTTQQGKVYSFRVSER
jgi:TPR repeat protein